MEHASRRLIHLSATADPTTAWTLQQLREAIPYDHEYRFIIHDHDSIFSAELDASLMRLGAWTNHNAGAQPAGELVLRKTDRDPAAGMSGLVYPVKRNALEKNLDIVDGSLTAADRIRPSGQAFPIRGWTTRESDPAVNAFRSVIESWPHRSWADCITNTGSRGLRRDVCVERLL
jgi:hypothetical protein